LVDITGGGITAGVNERYQQQLQVIAL